MSKEKMDFELPEELKAILPVSDKKRFIEIASSIWKIENPIQKYTVYLAQKFFQENILSFTDEEFSTAIKNRIFGRNYQGQPAYDIIRKCAEYKIVYPVGLNSWFDNSVSSSLHLKYIELIDKNNNVEQLELFNKKVPHLIENYFFKSANPSESLIRITLDKNPQNIFKISSWDDTKIANWIEKNPKHSKDILNHNLSNFKKNNFDFLKAKKVLYKNIIEEYLSISDPSQKEKDNFYLSFSGYPADYIEFLEENHSKLFNNFLYKKFEFASSDSSILNGAQTLILRREDSLTKTIEIFEKYKDLIKQDIKENIGFYTKETSIFEFCIRNSYFKPLVLFSFKDNLKDEEKDIITAGAFMFLKEKLEQTSSSSFKAKQNEILNDWYPQILVDCTDNHYQTYKNKLKPKSIKSSDFLKEFEAIDLYRNLRDKPTNNTGKKFKV